MTLRRGGAGGKMGFWSWASIASGPIAELPLFCNTKGCGVCEKEDGCACCWKGGLGPLVLSILVDAEEKW